MTAALAWKDVTISYAPRPGGHVHSPAPVLSEDRTGGAPAQLAPAADWMPMPETPADAPAADAPAADAPVR